MDPLEVLVATELFAGATREELEPLVPALRVRPFVKAAYVFRAGDPVTAFYVVVNGLVKVGVIGSDSHEWVANLKVRGDTFGEYWLFEETARRRYDAVAVEQTECLVVPNDALMYVLERHPKLMRRVAAVLLRRIRREFDIVIDTQSVDDIAGRVAQRLLLLARAHGEAAPVGIRIPIRMSQTMVAAMAGGSRENVNRALARMTADGLIAHDDGYITLLQPEKLESSLAGR
jgi:CRP/FNR family transcriptional regulator, cyclic AMP receptor protein